MSNEERATHARVLRLKNEPTNSDKTIKERLQDRIVPLGNECPHEQRSSHSSTTAADEAFATPFAGLASERSKAGKRGNLSAAELPEFGQFGNQDA